MQTLDRIAKNRYTEKIHLICLSEDADPYKLRNDKDMVDNMTLWPPVEYGHIFNRSTQTLYQATTSGKV